MITSKMKRFANSEGKKYTPLLEEWLQKNTKFVRKGEEDEGWDYMLVAEAEDWEQITTPVARMPNGIVTPTMRYYIGLNQALAFLRASKLISYSLIDYPTNAHYAIFVREKDGNRLKMPTVLKDKVRMPRIELLLTLTPDDFFDFIRVLHYSKVIDETKIVLNFPVLGLREEDYDTDIENPKVDLLRKFFKKMRINYTINPDIAMLQWMYKVSLADIADLEPTRDNQLSALQYIAALTSPQVDTIPTDSAVELELDWEQTVDERYVIAE